MALDQSERQFFDVLQASADFLYRQGVGDGGTAVEEAIRRLRSLPGHGKMEPSTKRGGTALTAHPRTTGDVAP